MTINICFFHFLHVSQKPWIFAQFSCKNEFCIQKYPNKHIFIGFAEKSHLPFLFCKPIAWRFFSLSAKKLMSNNLAIFGFFPSKKHDSVGIRHFCLRRLEKITKISKMMINILFPFFAYFLKTIDICSVFSAEMNSACKKYPNKHIFIGFAEKKPFTLPFLHSL